MKNIGSTLRWQHAKSPTSHEKLLDADGPTRRWHITALVAFSKALMFNISVAADADRARIALTALLRVRATTSDFFYTLHTHLFRELCGVTLSVRNRFYFS